MTKEVKLTAEQVQQRQLEILAAVDQFCRANELHYFINYGTLIGAVRHQGFIPWDDDIDISMPRADYERFLQLFGKKQQRYRVLSLAHDTVYFNNFAKIIDPTTRIVDHRNDKTYDSGIFIDVFPYDCFDDMKLVDQTYNLESFKLLSFSKWHNIVYRDRWWKDVARTAFWCLLRPVKPRFFAEKIERLIQQKSSATGRYQGLLASKFKEKEIFVAGTFDQLVEMPFEHLMVQAPANYDAILTQMYGDYRQLPPKDKQVNPHELDVYQKMEE